MDFYDVLDQVLDLLRQRGRVAYRVLKLQFKLDDETLEALKDELIYSQRLAVDAICSTISVKCRAGYAD